MDARPRTNLEATPPQRPGDHFRRLAFKLGFAIVLVVATPSGNAKAQDARPVRFWINVSDFSQQPVSSKQYRWVPDTVIATSIVGWTCKTKQIALRQSSSMKADPTYGLPAQAASMYQSGDVVCSSTCGTVSATAICTLSSADQSSLEDIRITDIAGHTVWVGVACRN
jgi:hypothetical protein